MRLPIERQALKQSASGTIMEVTQVDKRLLKLVFKDAVPDDIENQIRLSARQSSRKSVDCFAFCPA